MHLKTVSATYPEILLFCINVAFKQVTWGVPFYAFVASKVLNMNTGLINYLDWKKQIRGNGWSSRPLIAEQETKAAQNLWQIYADTLYAQVDPLQERESPAVREFCSWSALCDSRCAAFISDWLFWQEHAFLEQRKARPLDGIVSAQLCRKQLSDKCYLQPWMKYPQVPHKISRTSPKLLTGMRWWQRLSHKSRGWYQGPRDIIANS